MACAKGGAARSAVSGKLCVRHMLSHGVMSMFIHQSSESLKQQSDLTFDIAVRISPQYIK